MFTSIKVWALRQEYEIRIIMKNKRSTSEQMFFYFLFKVYSSIKVILQTFYERLKCLLIQITLLNRKHKLKKAYLILVHA